MRPESISFSRHCPPVPVAWKTKHSQSVSIDCRTCVMQDVVTPNMVRPTARLPPVTAGTALSAMPAAACAALPITVRVMALSPATSATACIIMMSVGPT